MNSRRILCLFLSTLLLTGCVHTPVAQPSATLPPARQPYEAPIGDVGLNHQSIAALYLPSLDGQQLLTFYEPLTLSHRQHPAETILRALLAHPGNSRVRSLGGEVTLALSGSNPVEVSGGVCTVNLAPSVLQLSTQDLYTVCLAISATLSETDGIRYVNLLVAGLPVSMDVTGYLPLGSVSAQTCMELPVLWEQLIARRTPVGENPAAMPLTATATLYFPLTDGTGIVPEIRRLSFAGQHPQQLVLGLLDALAAGADELTNVAAMPDLPSMMLSSPEVTELDSGGKRVTLHFVGDVRSRIAAAGIDPACCFAAMVNTLTTFVPALQQVCIRVGDGALTSLHNAARGSLLFPGGLHTRQDYAGYLMAQSTLYHLESGALHAHTVALPYRSVNDPRALLLTLAAAPAGHEVLPAGLTDADLLGLSVDGDTLLINLSARYAEIIRQSGMDQQLMAYAIVGSMCDNLHVNRIRFYFAGETLEHLGSDLVWSGEFLHNPGMLNRSYPGGTS
ncbi:MAG: GerMN domain-containing protein [Clostridia bacterium]|nr:GerMN domain-containing protein [Clostridia bacterium]